MLKKSLPVFCACLLAAGIASTALGGDDPFGDIGNALEPGKKIVIDGDGKEVKRDCGGLNVHVTGKKMKVTLTGECRSVDVSGEDHVVEVGAAEKINVNGKGNTIFWVNKFKGADPKVTSNGTSNKVAPKTPKK